MSKKISLIVSISSLGLGVALGCIFSGLQAPLHPHSEIEKSKPDVSNCDVSGLKKIISKFGEVGGNETYFGEDFDGKYSYSTYVKDLNILEKDGEYFAVNGCKNTSISGVINTALHNNILTVFSDIYGIEYPTKNSSNVSEKNAYIFLDPTCPFSQEFYKSSKIRDLQNEGYKVVLIPMSRKVKKDELLSYSELFCNVSEGERFGYFDKAITHGKALNISLTNPTSSCDYWKYIKALYSSFDTLGVKGFPSVLLSDRI